MARKNIFNITNSQGEFTSGRNLNVRNNKRKIPLYRNGDDSSQAYYAYDSVNPTGDKRMQGRQDLIRNADWAVTPSGKISGKSSSRAFDHIVPIIFREYQPRFSALVNNILYLSNQISQFSQTVIDKYSNDTEFTLNPLKGIRGLQEVSEIYNQNPLANSFQAYETGFSYELPYLQLDTQNFSTEFGSGEEGESILSKGMSFFRDRLANNPDSTLSVGKLAGIFSGDIASSLGSALYPAINPMEGRNVFYRASSPEGFTIQIDLLNTIDHDTAKYHKELIELWSHNMGMANVRNSLVGDSPTIFSIEIPHIKWVPACKIDFSYSGQGALVYIDGQPFPESYSCEFTVQEFFPPLRAVHHHYLKRGEKFHAINTNNSICDQLAQTVKIQKDLLDKVNPFN